jgi:hypothetical protein
VNRPSVPCLTAARVSAILQPYPFGEGNRTKCPLSQSRKGFCKIQVSLVLQPQGFLCLPGGSHGRAFGVVAKCEKSLCRSEKVHLQNTESPVPQQQGTLGTVARTDWVRLQNARSPCAAARRYVWTVAGGVEGWKAITGVLALRNEAEKWQWQ